MKYYFIDGGDNIERRYYATLREAKQAARELAEYSRFDIDVCPVEVSTKRAELLIRLNGLECGGEVFGDVVYIAKAKS